MNRADYKYSQCANASSFSLKLMELAGISEEGEGSILDDHHFVINFGQMESRERMSSDETMVFILISAEATVET